MASDRNLSFGINDKLIIPFETIKHSQLQYSENTAVLCLIYRLAHAKFPRSCQLWLHISTRLPQLRTSWLTFPYRGGCPATFDILHAFGRVTLIKVPLLLGPYEYYNRKQWVPPAYHRLIGQWVGMTPTYCLLWGSDRPEWCSRTPS